MRSLIAKHQVSALLLATAGVVACGDSGGGGGNPGGGTNNTFDSGPGTGNTGGDGGGTGNTGGDGGSAFTVGPNGCYNISLPTGGTVSAKPCTSDGGQSSTFQKCENEVPGGQCLTAAELVSSLFGGDGGSPFSIPDGGYNLPDGALDSLPPCPTNYECSSLLGSFASLVGAPSGASICAGSGAFFPPSCGSMTCEQLGLTSGSCVQGYCIQPCAVGSNP
jgi:hypothetical protein